MSDLPPISKKDVKSVTKTLLSVKKKDGTPLVSKEEADTLSTLRFKESGNVILTMEDRPFLYEVIWMLSYEKIGYQNTYNFLTTNWEKMLGKYNIRKKMMFENPLMNPAKEKFLVDMEIYTEKLDIEEAEVQCKRCSGSSVVTVSKQVRSADEPMTNFYVCIDCNNRWVAY